MERVVVRGNYHEEEMTMNSPNEDRKQTDNMDLLKQRTSDCAPGCARYGPELSRRQYRILGLILLLIGVMLGARGMVENRAASTEPAEPAFARMGTNMMNMMDMMQQMGMKPERMDRMQLLMRTGVFVDSPGALQVQKDKLGLSEEQSQKLGEIEKEARQKALTLLTPEQRTKLGDIPDKPVVMMEMCQEMMTMPAGPGRVK
jgi:hypothetical protein